MMDDAADPTDARPRTAGPSEWLEGARPRTWPNAFAPVIAGSAVAGLHGGFVGWKAVLAGVVALALIIGVNYANDYSDGIRGTDDDRVGPLRLTGSGLASPAAVKGAAFTFLGIAAIAGTALALTSAWWLILVGLACIVAAWFYTGGENPYGYRGFGEVAVFVFFGLVAVLGTEFVQLGRIEWIGFVGAVVVGAYSCAVNLTNNLRDIPTDIEAGKLTLAVRLGDGRTRGLHAVLVLLPIPLTGLFALHSPWLLLPLVTAPLAWFANAPVRSRAVGAGLIPALTRTGLAMLAWSVLLAAGVVLAART